MDIPPREGDTTRELEELFTEDSENTLRAIVRSDFDGLHVIRGESRTGKTTKLPYALHLLSKGKVLCIQPTEESCVRVGSYVKNKFGSKVGFLDAWEPKKTKDAMVTYTSVKQILAGEILKPSEAPIKLNVVSFILLDEAHVESAEYMLALTLILKKQATNALFHKVKILLVSSFLRPNDKIQIKYERLSGIRNYELHEPRPGGQLIKKYAHEDVSTQLQDFASWATQSLAKIQQGIKAMIVVPYQDFRPASVYLQRTIRRSLKDCPPIYIKELHQSRTPELMFDTENFIVLAQLHTCSHIHVPQIRQILCPHWQAAREFNAEVSKEVIDSKTYMTDSEFRFIESYGPADAEVVYSCTQSTRTDALPFGPRIVDTLDPILYVFLASAIFEGCFSPSPNNEPRWLQPTWSVPCFFSPESVLWARIRLRYKGYRLLEPQARTQIEKLTSLGTRVVKLLLLTDLDFLMGIYVASHQTEDNIGWTIATAIAGSSGVPVLQLQHGELRKPDKYNLTGKQKSGDTQEKRPQKLTLKHIKDLRLLTMGTAAMTKTQINTIETDSTFQDIGDIVSDTAFLILRTREETALVPRPAGAQSFEYGPWIDTSEASSDLQHMVARMNRVGRAIGWDPAGLQCFPPAIAEQSEDGRQQFAEWSRWLPTFAESWLSSHMYNFAFVKVEDRMGEEMGADWTYKSIDNTLFTATDFCSGLEVHLDPASTISLSQSYISFGRKEGFYVTYTTMREVANGIWQISGILFVPPVGVENLASRIKEEVPGGTGFDDLLQTTLKR